MLITSEVTGGVGPSVDGLGSNRSYEFPRLLISTPVICDPCVSTVNCTGSLPGVLLPATSVNVATAV